MEAAVLIWPENWPAFEVFSALRTQWRVAHCGRTGLDYASIPITLRLFEVPRKDWKDVFSSLRVMEAAALQEMYKDDK